MDGMGGINRDIQSTAMAVSPWLFGVDEWGDFRWLTKILIMFLLTTIYMVNHLLIYAVFSQNKFH
jgi:hypothetical protein